MATTLTLSAHVQNLLASVESMARLDVLLHVHALNGEPVTPATIASVCRMSQLAAEHHLAKLCARGLLAVNIETDLHYSYRPIEPLVRSAVEEVERSYRTRREGLAVWFAASQHPHALIAEDDADMREIVRSFVEARGFRATALPNGRQSLACAETEALALSIVDVRRSVPAGLVLTRALRQRIEPVPTIVTTCLGDVHLHAQISGLGVAAVLEKPFDLDDLARVLDAEGSVHKIV